MHFPVKKAVFPVAGIGTRFLPATKANPKEMLPIVDKPLIQYAVEEAVKANLTEMIFVTSSAKRAIEDHFDHDYALEQKLLEQGKHALCEIVRSISPPDIRFTYVRQPKMLGLGHALLCAKHIVGSEPFAVLLADDLIEDTTFPCLSAMVEHYQKTGFSCVAVQEVPESDVHKYGIVGIDDFNNHIASIHTIIEKPIEQQAPSNFAVIGRYVFSSKIFDCLENISPDHRNEIQLTDAIEQLIQTQPVSAFRFDGKRHDCGSTLGYVTATLEYALQCPDIGNALRKHPLINPNAS